MRSLVILSAIHCLAACCFAALATGAEVRKWTARAGNFSTEAELIDVTGGNVVLKRTDGKTITVPLDRLSLADVRYVENFLRDATAAVGRPVGEPDSKQAKNETSSPRTAKSSDDDGPPLARPNVSQWQVRPDPGDDIQIRDLSIPLPHENGSGDLLIPATPSRYIGYVTSGFKPTIQSWDMRTGDRFGPITMEGHLHPPPVLSPDGDLVAVFLRAAGKSKLQVWSLKRKSVAKEIDLDERSGLIQFMKFAGPKRLLINEGFNQGLRVLDPRSGAEIAKIDARSTSPLQHVAISPGGAYLAMCDSFNGPLRFYDARNGEMAGELNVDRGNAGGGQFSAFQFSADGQEFAALTESRQPALYCWSMKTGKPVAEHTFSRNLHELGVMHGAGVDFIPGNKGWLLGGKAVVDREKGGPVWVAKSNSGRDTTYLRMLDAERMLVVAGPYDNRRVTIDRLPWDEISKSAVVVEKGGTAKDFELPPITKANGEAGRELALSPQVQTWKVPLDANARGPQLELQTIQLGVQPPIGDSVLIAPRGLKAIVAARTIPRTGDSQPKHRFRRLDLKSGKEEAALELNFGARPIDVNLDGTRLLVEATASDDRLDLYDLATSKHLVGFRPYGGLDSFRSKVKWAALLDGDRLMTLSNEGKLVLWSIPDCQAIYHARLTQLQSPILSPSRNYLIVPVEGAYQAIDIPTGERLGALKTPQFDQGRMMSGYDFSPDEKLLAAVFRDIKNAALVCWDLSSGEIKRQYDLEAGEDVTWTNDSRLLVHRTLAEDRNARVYRFPIRRSDLIELSTGRVLWRYQLPMGQFGSQRAGGLVWYLSTKEFGQPTSLIGATIPSREIAAKMSDAPRPKNLLPAGTALTVDVTVSITGDALADKVLRDQVRQNVAEYLTKRGIDVEERTALALRVSLRESLTGSFLELRPILGGVAGRYQVRGKELTCSLELTDVTRQSLWSRNKTIPMRLEVPRTGIPSGTSPDEFVRQQQWTDAMNWVTAGGLPDEIHEAWAYSGMGESVLTPAGESLLSLNLPSK